MKTWIDITTPISEDMMVYKNKPVKMTKIETRATHAKDGYHESTLHMDLHAGTHIDMPLHMVDGGLDSTDFDVASVNGPCVVVDFSNEKEAEVTASFLEKQAIQPGDIVVIKTKNAYAKVFDANYDYLEASGATYLKDLGVKAVGIDALGIERSDPDHPTHTILLTNGIPIIEGLKLDAVSGGRYDFICLPLKIVGVEGLPARIYLDPK
ncbi:cyclase family protein [Fusibacter tunisiensis]|uniref:Arylformamidase n=1 Tax=Fusibacter tunisiensis TaxID=1008308 RepID=A0ABS2MT36_9FIRM|nr:cyclase family protein [Fusibacter tunisiensis]MBM7562559.1 arylformamidase [Fusibacter tunisiensis]